MSGAHCQFSSLVSVFGAGISIADVWDRQILEALPSRRPSGSTQNHNNKDSYGGGRKVSKHLWCLIALLCFITENMFDLEVETTEQSCFS